MPSSPVTEKKINGDRKWNNLIPFGSDVLFGIKFITPLIYVNLISISLLHFGCLYALLTFPWIRKWKLALFCIFYGLLGGFGVTAGAHRCFTHRSFKPRTPLKLFLLLLYAVAGQNKLHEWVRDHRVHHKFSETDADPHNARRGFFFAHVGWLMMKKHPDVITKGRTVDMSDLTGDPVLVLFDKYFSLIKFVFCFALPILFVRYFFGEGWYWSVMSQIFGRYVLMLNFTWLVNSAAHLYGNKPYNKTINPRENLTVSIFGLGEGWHNFHHTFPWDYKASEYGKWNVTTFWLDLFGKLGLAYDFKTTSPDLIRRVGVKLGDGTRNDWGCYVDEDGKIRSTEDD